MLRGHGILNCFELCGKEFNYFPTLRADHVVVVLMFVLMFVVSAAIAEANLACKSCFREELERAVDGCLTHARVFLLNEPI